MASAPALDLRDTRSQIFKDNGFVHGISRLVNGLIRSLFVLRCLFESIAAAGGCAARTTAAPRESANSCAEIFFGARIGEANRLSFGAK